MLLTLMKVILHQEIGVLSEYFAPVFMNVHLKGQKESNIQKISKWHVSVPVFIYIYKVPRGVTWLMLMN